LEASSTAEPGAGAGRSEHGLKRGAIGFLATLTIGVASVAPGYSLAAILGFTAFEVGEQLPAVLLVSFIPMLFVATAYYYLNRADPDCGTTFAWASRALGPTMAGLPAGRSSRPASSSSACSPTRRPTTPTTSSAGRRPATARPA
jgi:amino acid transporter